MKQTTLYYIHDPMCSWCWGFRPVWQQCREQLPSNIEIRYLLGGLAADANEPMSMDLQKTLQQTWQHIQQRIPDTEFNFDFWKECAPRRSTYPACRAVIAARHQGSQFEEAMILAIQQAYYQRAENPSDDVVLIQCAENIGLDIQQFSYMLNAQETQKNLESEMRLVQEMGVRGFPSLLLMQNGRASLLDLDYNHADNILRQINYSASS